MPTPSPDPGEAALRDALAVTRTQLANERTLLAYARTAIMLLSTGAAVIKWFEPSPTTWASGWGLVALGGLVVAVGWRRFAAVRRGLT